MTANNKHSRQNWVTGETQLVSTAIVDYPSAVIILNWPRPRRLLFICAGLDLLGLLVCAALIDRYRNRVIAAYPLGLGLVSAAYLLFSWLFGSAPSCAVPRCDCGWSCLGWAGPRAPTCHW